MHSLWTYENKSKFQAKLFKLCNNVSWSLPCIPMVGQIDSQVIQNTNKNRHTHKTIYVCHYFLNGANMLFLCLHPLLQLIPHVVFLEQMPRISSWCFLFSSSNLKNSYQLSLPMSAHCNTLELLYCEITVLLLCPSVICLSMRRIFVLKLWTISRTTTNCFQ